jgi:hypothetical protein
MLALPVANKLISVSDMGALIVSEISSGDELQSLFPVLPYRHALKTLVELPSRKNIVATDFMGRIFIWTYDPTVELVI